MHPEIELVARAIHKAEQQGLPWESQSERSKERFRVCARNAITLLDDDIGVLLHALEESTLERQG